METKKRRKGGEGYLHPTWCMCGALVSASEVITKNLLNI